MANERTVELAVTHSSAPGPGQTLRFPLSMTVGDLKAQHLAAGASVATTPLGIAGATTTDDSATIGSRIPPYFESASALVVGTEPPIFPAPRSSQFKEWPGASRNLPRPEILDTTQWVDRNATKQPPRPSKTPSSKTRHGVGEPVTPLPPSPPPPPMTLSSPSRPRFSTPGTRPERTALELWSRSPKNDGTVGWFETGFKSFTLLHETVCAKVYAVTDASGSKSVVKYIKTRKMAEGEISVMSLIPAHPNVVELLCAWKENSGFFLQLEFFESTLASCAHDVFASNAISLFLDAAKGLAHLHELTIIHNDVKPANLFIRSQTPARPRLLVGDLGSASLTVGEPLWDRTDSKFVCPEHISSKAADVYSLGLTFLGLFIDVEMPDAGSELWQRIRFCSVAELFAERAERCKTVNEEIVQLLGAMLKHDPLHRPTAQHIVKQLTTILPRVKSPSPSSRSPSPKFSASAAAAVAAAFESARSPSPGPRTPGVRKSLSSSFEGRRSPSPTPRAQSLEGRISPRTFAAPPLEGRRSPGSPTIFASPEPM